MTNEEYRAKTGIKTTEQAVVYLLWLRLAFFAYVLGAVAIGASIYFAWPAAPVLFALLVEIVAFLSLTYLAITILYLDGESVLLVLVMAIIPFAWFWGYFKLAKPLKIVIGSRSAPEKTPTRFLAAHINPLMPYLAMASNRFLLALAIVGALIGVGFLTKSAAPGSAGLIYRFTAPDNSFSISFPSKPTSADNGDNKGTYYSARGLDGEQYMLDAVNLPVVNKNGVAVDDQTVYDNILQGVVKASNGEIISKDNITTASGAGLHFIGRMTTPMDVNMEGEMIRSGVHVYVMTVLASDNNPTNHPAGMLDFFQSFNINQ